MTYDYADWDDENYGDGETAVTLSLELSPTLGGDDGVTFVTQALAGAVTLRFTIAPDDILDLLARIALYGDVDGEQLLRVVNDALVERARRAQSSTG